MNSSIPKAKQKQYADYVKQITPTHSLPMNMAKAFFTGGVICVVGQIITNFAKSRGLDQDMAGTWCSVTLVFISVILTGFNIYPKIGKFGGAGSLVPITGFANSVAAPAIEYKTEGQVWESSLITTIFGFLKNSRIYKFHDKPPENKNNILKINFIYKRLSW